MTDRKTIFDAIKEAREGRAFTAMMVRQIDELLDALDVPREQAGARTISPAGIALIKRFEGMELRAYPDPGTGGKPWTIGIGSTVYPSGQAVKPGDVITEAQAEEYLQHDLAKYAAEVEAALGGSPTTQAQFDALVSFHYNTGAIGRATLTKLHKAGDYAGAAAEFSKWVNAGGKRLTGLVRRRAAEAQLYRAGTP